MYPMSMCDKPLMLSRTRSKRQGLSCKINHGCRGVAWLRCYPVGKHVIAAYRNSRQTRLTICTSLLQREPHDSGDHVRPAMHSHSRFPLQLTGAYIRLPSRASPVPDQNQQDIGPIPNWTASSRWRCRQTVYSPSYWSPFAPSALDRRAHIEPVPTD